MNSSKIELLDETQCEDLESELVERIYEFNAEATGCFDGKLLGGCVRNADGELIAGFNGHTWAGTCVLTNVWVAQAYRGQGHGRALLETAEAEALRRSCTQVILGTHSFQSPGFYEGMGYQRVVSIADWPQGHSEIVMRKLLSTETGA